MRRDNPYRKLLRARKKLLYKLKEIEQTLRRVMQCEMCGAEMKEDEVVECACCGAVLCPGCDIDGFCPNCAGSGMLD